MIPYKSQILSSIIIIIIMMTIIIKRIYVSQRERNDDDDPTIFFLSEFSLLKKKKRSVSYRNITFDLFVCIHHCVNTAAKSIIIIIVFVGYLYLHYSHSHFILIPSDLTFMTFSNPNKFFYMFFFFDLFVCQSENMKNKKNRINFIIKPGETQ